MKTAWRCVGLTLLLAWPGASVASGQTSSTPAPPDVASAPLWSVRAAAATYFLPEDDNYVQPTAAVDRGWLHLESRYNYEDRHSISGFIGWNFSVGGKKVTLDITPMFGGVTGDTDGVMPALELTLAFWRVEAYSEGEYVINLDRPQDRFLYNWSEVSVWATDWLRAGLVTQRTRTLRFARASEREIERGILTGVNIGKLEGTVYYFNPGSDDTYVVAALGVTMRFR